MFQGSHHRLVVDRVGYHTVGQLTGQHGPELIASQFWVHMAKGQRMEASVPAPDAHVLHFGGHHRLVLYPPQGVDQVVAHHPPSVKVMILETVGDRRHAAEPAIPAPFSSS